MHRCDLCNKDNVTVKLDGVKYCSECYIDKRLWKCDVCNIWHIRLDYDCNKCRKGICSLVCVAVTGTQTIECICRKCFDWKCEICDAPINVLEEDYVYLWDEDPLPRCELCLIG
jgi:hypothetical protein